MSDIEHKFESYEYFEIPTSVNSHKVILKFIEYVTRGRNSAILSSTKENPDISK